MLKGMMEDVTCRYGLVCSRLRDQLTPFLTSEIPNVDHMNHYLNKSKSKNSPGEVESHRINNLYKVCLMANFICKDFLNEYYFVTLRFIGLYYVPTSVESGA